MKYKCNRQQGTYLALLTGKCETNPKWVFERKFVNYNEAENGYILDDGIYEFRKDAKAYNKEYFQVKENRMIDLFPHEAKQLLGIETKKPNLATLEKQIWYKNHIIKVAKIEASHQLIAARDEQGKIKYTGERGNKCEYVRVPAEKPGEYVAYHKSQAHYFDDLEQVLKWLILEKEIQTVQLFQQKIETSPLFESEHPQVLKVSSFGFASSQEFEMKSFDKKAEKIIRECTRYIKLYQLYFDYSQQSIDFLTNWIREKIINIVSETTADWMGTRHPIANYENSMLSFNKQYEEVYTERLQLEIIGRRI
jgi:hypothetical protein